MTAAGSATRPRPRSGPARAVEPPWPTLAVVGGLLLLLVRPWERGLGGSAALLVGVHGAGRRLAGAAIGSRTARVASPERAGVAGAPLGFTFPLILGLAAVSGGGLPGGPGPPPGASPRRGWP